MNLLLGEEIRDIAGYKGLYSVTSEGRIWSHVSNIWLKLITASNGYSRVGLYDYLGSCQQYSVHTLVLQTFVGLAPEGLICSHEDDDKSNNKLDNLSWKTQQYNNEKERGGLNLNVGETNGRSKLTEDDVLEIRRKYGEGLKGYRLAQEYGISPQALNKIIRKKLWSHLP